MYNDNIIWNKINNNKKLLFDKKKEIEYLMNEFGTKLRCNRFNIGNVIEFIISDFFKKIGLNIKELTDANRVDIKIINYGELSIKYSSCGDVILHNSMGLNKNNEIVDLLLITQNEFILFTKKQLEKNNINYSKFIYNNKDSLKLKRKIIKELKQKKYPFILDFKLGFTTFGCETGGFNKNNCKNRLCSKLFYESFIVEFKSHNIEEYNEIDRKNNCK